MTVLQDNLLPTLDYLLREWLDLGSLLERPRFRDHDLDGVADLLQTASAIAAQRFEPANRNDHEPHMVDGRVVLPEVSRQAWDAYAAFGLLQAAHDVEHGGMQLPRVVDSTRAPTGFRDSTCWGAR